MLNPIERTQSSDDARRYRLEPYAIAADIASAAPHAGRGGWSWYTGAAAWSWRLGVEAILGLHLEAGGLRIDPQIPRRWAGFEATVRTEGGVLEIRVENTQGAEGNEIEITVDGARIEDNLVALPSDGATRQVRVRINRSPNG
jgi:cyclic beta-1,2-glucan synthetase